MQKGMRMKKWFVRYAMTCSRYTQYDGRSSRGDMWNFILVTMLAELVAYMLGGNLLVAVVHIIAMIVMAALAVRRFHDIGASGWYLLSLFIPVVNLCALFVLLCVKSEPGINRYGAPPGDDDGKGPTAQAA